MRIESKKLVAAVVMSMAFSLTCSANVLEAAPAVPEAAPVVLEAAPAVPEAAPVVPEAVSAVPEAAPAATTVAVQVEVKQPVVQENKSEVSTKGIFNWDRGPSADIVAVGVGVRDQRGLALSRRAAIVDAQRHLLETIKGTEIDANTLVESLMVKSDEVKSSVKGLLVGAKIVEEGENNDGSYYVKMSVPMFGAGQSLAAMVMPQMDKNVVPQQLPTVQTTKLNQNEVQKLRSIRHTGVVVDASGLGLEPTFAPVIYDTNGRIVYGLSNLDKNLAIAQGMVAYANDVQNAVSVSRAGNNPLVVKAVSVKGGKNSVNPVNVVVSVDDADKILLANQSTNMLQSAAVVFVK